MSQDHSEYLKDLHRIFFESPNIPTQQCIEEAVLLSHQEVHVCSKTVPLSLEPPIIRSRFTNEMSRSIHALLFGGVSERENICSRVTQLMEDWKGWIKISYAELVIRRHQETFEHIK